jgi:hypothetical protein
MMKSKLPASKIQHPATGVNERPVDGVRPEAIVATAERTVNGVPVSSLPTHVQDLITYAMTDQGVAEKNARRVDSQGRPHSGIQVLVNEGFDQKILQRSKAQEPWETADPLLDAKNEHAVPGFRYRGISPTVNRKKGLRGWEPVTGAKGDVVTVGNLILARMPEEKAEKRNKHYRDIGNANAADAAGRLTEDHERAAHDSKSEGIRPLRAGETLTDDGDPTRRISIGVRSSRDGQGADAAA